MTGSSAEGKRVAFRADAAFSEADDHLHWTLLEQRDVDYARYSRTWSRRTRARGAPPRSRIVPEGGPPHLRQRARTPLVPKTRKFFFGVYPDFPTIFRGFSEFFVGDLMGKALWKLVENAQRFPRRGGRVLCVHGPVSFHRARPCATKWPPRRGLRTGPPASSDCGRPVNDKCSHQHRRSVQAERSSCPGKRVISGTYAIWETRI